jgi:hypothetical protein
MNILIRRGYRPGDKVPSRCTLLCDARCADGGPRARPHCVRGMRTGLIPCAVWGRARDSKHMASSARGVAGGGRCGRALSDGGLTPGRQKLRYDSF